MVTKRGYRNKDRTTVVIEGSYIMKALKKIIDNEKRKSKNPDSPPMSYKSAVEYAILRTADGYAEGG